MSGNTTSNHTAITRAQVYSDYMLEVLRSDFLPEGLHRDVSDFGDGTTLFIPVIGETIVRDYVEDTDIQFDAFDSGQVTLTITDYVGAGTYITDKLAQDAYKSPELERRIPDGQLFQIKRRWETSLLAAGPAGQTTNNPNTINGFSHRWVADSGTTAGVLTLDDLFYAKLSLDKADSPEEGRIAIVDPVVEMTLNKLLGAQVFINNPNVQGLYETGLAQHMKFLRNFAGFDIYLSNRLPTVTQTITGGPAGTAETVTAGKANQFFCIGDDMCKPVMGAMRQAPKLEGFRNVSKKRDEYSTTARWGFGLQRPETLVTICTHATAFA